MAMRPVTAVELAARAADRWRSQYRGWTDSDTFADGTTKGATNEALNNHRHTPENIARILNPGWVYPDCGGCGKLFPVVIEIKDDWRDEGIRLCANCLQSGVTQIEQFANAKAEVKRK